MTMFRKVFSNHLAAQEEVEPAAPAGAATDDTDAALPLGEDIAIPERDPDAGSTNIFVEEPQQDALPAPESIDEPALDDATSLAQRAAEAHRKILETQQPAPADPQPSASEAPPQPLRLVDDPVDGAPNAASSVGIEVDQTAAQSLEAAVETVDTPVTPPPSAPRPAGRARTRLLGFDAGATAAFDPFAATAQENVNPQTRTHPAGWLVIVAGHGEGQSFAIHNGVAMVGRGDDQGIRLDFGDQTISRQNHAAVAYDAEDNAFYIGHGGKSNIIRLNGKPVLSTEPLTHGDVVRIGETQLRLVALCGSDFQWGKADEA